MNDEGEEYFVPLQDQRVFGAGVRRKRIDFIPAEQNSTDTITQTNSTTNIGDRYLSIVLSNSKTLGKAEPQETAAQGEDLATKSHKKRHLDMPLCEICNLPIASTEETEITKLRPHEASLAHQVCLSHSDPPSHLDRNRCGLKYLSSYGWDPDSRLGLGATGRGIRVPIKETPKNDTVGLGLTRTAQSVNIRKVTGRRVEKLDAKQMRKREVEERRKREKLQDMFFRNDDLEKYLGPG
ncbi:hypothetical protein MMC12_001673 [Toensbergia leucococca]|nr:hypothetical protein [Toensbergia leucococca]